MKKILIPELFALFLITICTHYSIAQGAAAPDTFKYKNIETKIKMRQKFDIEHFNKHMNVGEYTFKMDDGMIIRQEGDYNDAEQKVDGYREYHQYPNSPYVYIEAYDSKGNIVSSSNKFYNMGIGTAMSYDKLGKSHIDEDYDAPYKLSINDLKAKMREEYNIDITDKNTTQDVKRWIGGGEAFYQVDVSVPNSKDSDAYLIDANTGKTLGTIRVEFQRGDRYNPGPKQETMVEEYRRKKQEEEK